MNMKYPEPYKRPESPYYYFKYTDPDTGKRIPKSTGCTLKKDARDEIAEFIDNLDFHRGTLAVYADPFFTDRCPRVRRLRQEGKSIGTSHIRKSRAYLVNHILTDPIANIPITKIRRRDLYDFRNRLEDSVGRTNTLNKIVAVLTTILSEAALREDIPGNPGQGLGAVKYEKRQRKALSPEEVSRILLSGSAVASLLALTGMRVGEVLALSAKQRVGRLLTIDRAWKTSTELGPPKWGKIRIIPLCTRAVEIFESLPLAEDLLFHHPDGSRLGETWIRNHFLKIAPDITPHYLRHSLNTNLLAAGADPILVQAYLGWSPRALTPVQLQYTHLGGQRLQPIADMIDTIYR